MMTKEKASISLFLYVIEKLQKINLQVERLQQENFKLTKQLECSKITHKLSVQENTQKIGELIKEKNVRYRYNSSFYIFVCIPTFYNNYRTVRQELSYTINVLKMQLKLYKL